MPSFDYDLDDRVSMETQAEAHCQEQPQEDKPVEQSAQPVHLCKFDEAALVELKQQIAGLQDLFVRRLYDDKQKGVLITSLEEKASFAYVEPFLSDIILLLDRLERASPENSEFAMSVADELYEMVNRRGVERIKVTEKFDPALNKAVRVENDDTVDTPRVSHIIRNGYTFGGKVLRPAEVVIVRKRRG